ncbi:hypothetical protein VTI28DRAFT_10160 [Corynascus sepedonium]
MEAEPCGSTEGCSSAQYVAQELQTSILPPKTIRNHHLPNSEHHLSPLSHNRTERSRLELGRSGEHTSFQAAPRPSTIMAPKPYLRALSQCIYTLGCGTSRENVPRHLDRCSPLSIEPSPSSFKAAPCRARIQPPVQLPVSSRPANRHLLPGRRWQWPCGLRYPSISLC